MLNQVPVPGPLRRGGLGEGVDHFPLLEAREEQRLVDGFLARDRVGLLLHVQVHELAQDGQPGVALEHPLPQVAGGRAVRVDRVALVPVVAHVERQEAGGGALQVGGHERLGVGDGEVHQSAVPEGEQRLGAAGDRVHGVAGGLVLVDGVLDRLGEVRLQFHGGHGQPVDEEHQVDAVLVVRRVVDLPHHPEAHLGVVGDRFGVEVVSRLELAHRQGRRRHLESVAQHRQSAAAVFERRVEDFGEAFQEAIEGLLLGVRAVRGVDDLAELLGLGFLQPQADILRVEG